MKKTIETKLDKARSKKAIDKAMDDYKARFAEYSPHFDWKTDDIGDYSFSAKGVKCAGTIHVLDNKVNVEMDVPFLFKIFQGRAMQVIQDQVVFWVEKAKKGEI